MCSKFAASQQYEKFPICQTFDTIFVPDSEQKLSLNPPECRHVGGAKNASCQNGLRRQFWGIGGELLVLWFGRQSVVGLGVINDLAQQFLAEWRQRALP